MRSMTRISNHKKLISTPVLVSYLFRIITKSANTCSTTESQLGHSTAEIFVNSCTSQLSFSQEHSECISHLGRVWLASSPHRAAQQQRRCQKCGARLACQTFGRLWRKNELQSCGRAAARHKCGREPNTCQNCGAESAAQCGRQPNAPLLPGHTGKT
jgi:hypothetical protein